MKLTILGSGGNVPTPRISCNCEVCISARTKGYPFKRNLAALYIEDSKTVIDCPEDISESLNKHNIFDIDNLFITHWHPDHTFGFRLLVQANYDFIHDKCNKKINIYLPEIVLKKFKEIYPSIDYFISEKKMANIILVKNDEPIKINNTTIIPKEYYKGSEHYAYLIKSDNKQVLYAPCDTIDLKNEFKNLDILIHEQGYFSSEITWELSFDHLLKRIKQWIPKKTILTHISEDELKRWSWNIIAEKEKIAKKEGISLKFAHDGQIIKL